MLVFLIAAISANGLIAKDPNKPSTSWTSPEDKQFFVSRTKQAGVCVFGSKTYATFGRPLKDRLNIIYTSKPKKIKPAPNLQTTKLPPNKLINDLRSKNYHQVAICGGASIYTMFLKAGIVDKLYLTVEPVLFGQGTNLINDNLNLNLNLKLEKLQKLSSQTLLLEYSLQN